MTSMAFQTRTVAMTSRTRGGFGIARLAQVPGALGEVSAGVAARAGARLGAAPPALPSPALLLQSAALLANARTLPPDRPHRI